MPAALQRSSRLMLLALTLPTLTACARADGGTNGDRTPYLADVLTLEQMLQDAPEATEVLLADPDGITVDEQGRLLVADDYCIKVFDEEGRPVGRIGRKGKGPGEFDAPMRPSAGPTGYLTVQDILWAWNLYDGEGSFLSRRNYRIEKPFQEYIQRNHFTFTMLNRVVPYDATDCLVDLFGFDGNLEERFHAREQLLLSSPNGLAELVQYPSRSTFRVDAQSSNSVELQGELLWAVTGPGRLAYVHAYHDVHWQSDGVEGGPYWRLTDLDLPAMARHTITVPFEPMRIPEACKRLVPIYNDFLGRWFEQNPLEQEILTATEFYPPVRALRADGDLVFAFHYCPEDSAQYELDEEEVTERWREVDVIDLAEGRVVVRTRFPFIPDVIRDGRAWRLFQPLDDFASVQRFRIDPRVYTSVSERH